MNRVRIQDLPLLPTFIVRAYDSPDAPPWSEFQLVTTAQVEKPGEVWIHGMHGLSSWMIWRAMGENLLRRDLQFVRAMRAPGRRLPRGEEMPDGSLRIDLERLLRKPTADTNFAGL